MKVPDKLYCWRGSLGSLYCSPQNDAGINCSEYIRKDALLEWLKKEYETISWYYEKMKHVTGCIGDSYGKVEAYKKVIDKIESL